MSWIKRMWPVLVCLVASVLILGGFVVRPNLAASDGTQASRGTAIPLEVSQTATKKIDTLKRWFYSFNAERSRTLDTTIWTVENSATTAAYNNELQTYTNRPENIRIEDDALLIEGRVEQYEGKSYTSARINTQDAFAFTYGKLEVDMKLPSGIGTWPAAWLMPNNERYKPADFPSVTDPKRQWALNGEIDFMEAVGYLPGEIIPATHSYNSLGGAVIYTPGFVDRPHDTYHRYGIVKTRDSISFTIDGVTYASRTKTNDNPLDWPYDQPYYLILNLAIGGEWAGAHGVDKVTSPWRLYVRSIAYEPL